MTTGQRSAGRLDVPALDAVGDRLEAAEVARSAAHAWLLSEALLLDRLLCEAGMGLSTGADLALRLRCSQWRADRLLEQARVLSGLPDGLGVLAEGLLTVEQAGVFVTETARLAAGPLLRVWEQLVARLRAGVESGEVLPPGRLTTLLRRWVLAAAPLEAVAERGRAAAGRKVEVRRREDGLADLFALGISAPNAHACLSRIQAASAPVGPDDTRTADQRRLDALVDLITGRISLPQLGVDPSDAEAVSGGCGCPSGAPVPCGADLQVLVPLGAALETTDELAELVGAGPLDPDQLRRLLLSAPRLRPIWVDEHGVPVATGRRTWQPPRGEPAEVRAQLLALAAQAPPLPEPRHPDDHQLNDHPPDIRVSDLGQRSEGVERGSPRSGSTSGVAEPAVGQGRGHPPDSAGPYHVGDRLRRLLTVRRPLCEWPGCGMPARRCDMEHDVAWPAGPTCGCGLGPCCRRHHRIKQTGWTKTRRATGVTWTGPTGRAWWSPSPHEPPARAARPLPGLPVPDPTALLSRLEWESELDPDVALLSDVGIGGGCDDVEPVDVDDPLGRRLRRSDTTWSLDLADAQDWQDIPHTADR